MNPKDSDSTIPILPLALGAGAVLAGVVLMVIVWGSGKNTVSPPIEEPNRWIRIDGATNKLLGTTEDAPPSIRGFRPSRQIFAPSTAFEIQQHEVTWEEIDPWLDKNPVHAFQKPPQTSTARADQKSFPAQGVPYSVALAYCRSIGGNLPTEEQWELAARGPMMNKFPWGNDVPDWSRVHSFRGAAGMPTKVMTNAQDRTVGSPDKTIYDLAGNVREWTSSVWRDDFPGTDESWVRADDVSVFAVRGFPLLRDLIGRADELSVAHRDWICAIGDCSPLSAAASAHEKARKPKLELWANADSIHPGAMAWRRIIEAPNVVASLSRCFSGPTSSKMTIKATKETFCNRPEHAPTNGRCGDAPALVGALLHVSDGLAETNAKCVNYQFHGVSVTNLATQLPDTEFSYTLQVSTGAIEELRDVGFRCARDVSSP